MTTTPHSEQEWDQLKREFNAACVQSAQSARVQVAHELNQLFRRLRQYEKEADWVRLVMEGAANYARQAALFAVQGDTLVVRSVANLNLDEKFSFASASAAAFDSVLRSKEPVTALRTNSEVGTALSSSGHLAYLFPILNATRVVAVLFASADESEVDQLELISNMAASALEGKAHGSPNSVHSQIAPLTALPKPEAQPLVAQRRLPIWADLPAEHRALHCEASRFARVAVAEMQLLKSVACRTAREKGDLYLVLGKEIDKARETYRQQFMILPSMADYFHKELVESILNGESRKLGADYPGELS